MKLAVLGGTFDPIHKGHLMMAESALRHLNLSQVLFMPAGRPRFKDEDAVTPAEHRLRMVELAIDGKPAFRLSAMEIERRGVTYTVDTLRKLKSGLEPADELFFIMGWDSLAELPLWHRPSDLISLCSLVAVPRAGRTQPDLKLLEKKIAGLSRKLFMLDEPVVDICSSDIRNRVRDGLDIRELVPDSVADYIAEKGLYR